MTSSAYYSNSDPVYWPYYPLSDIRMDQSIYPTSTCHQIPQPHQQPSSYPSDSALSNPPSSLLETLLRHGRQAISENYPGLEKRSPGLSCRPSECSLASQSSPSSLLESLLQKSPEAIENYSTPSGNPSPGHPTSSQIPCHTPPYTPSSSSDRNSPMSGLVIDSSSQERYPMPGRSAEYTGINYPQYQAYPSQPSLTSCVAPIVTPASPPTIYESVHPGYTSYGNNNNNGKASPTGSCDYSDDPQPKMGDYAWMKSSYASGESHNTWKNIL